MVDKMKKILLLFLVILAVGCVNTITQLGGISVTVQADPPKVFSGGTTRFFVDVENTDKKTYRSVSTEVFDAGIIDVKSCNKKGLDEMRPNQTYTIKCDLAGPKVESSSIQQVSVKTSFTTDMNFIQSYQMATEDAYKRESARGSLKYMPKSYSYRDSYIESNIEFSEDLPIVIRDKKNYMYIKITNIGPGTVKLLDVKGKENVKCGKPVVDTVGKEFPRVVCELTSTVKDLTNFDELITVTYYYELINTAQIEIIK